ncbi:Dihydrolipoyllysine-residue succinyltransferase component of 2-oxoglutarate dehydrogenase complex, mitochondrial [Thelohanellus kitauei]|uniref:Dihydrolipoyllysine-residue succinyltransferase component of 2-oxoglutarate dehydrogenase complex, mitochondrial n=1 Tax=Thelohanellus kitauei TaxID=669202 RepID=A0A0C2J9C8_THEKT|nr:Dihydrolipoyllysine-residue succinyltransferase component of 2-oxoglutarate dehydrogenase complex, mitochondrial [Thelohanellus kitauei]
MFRFVRSGLSIKAVKLGSKQRLDTIWVPSARLWNLKTFTTSSIVFKVCPVKTPNFPESITEGDIRWLKKVGDAVKTDETIGELETDKTSLPVISPVSGVIKELIIPEGSKVTKGQILCHVEEQAQSAEVTAPRISLETVKPSPVVQSEGPKKETKDTSSMTAFSQSERIETRVPLNRMRQTISSRLKEAQNTTAMLTTFNELDMTSAFLIRNKYKDRLLKDYGVKFGFMSIFINASVHALKSQPMVNSVLMKNEIVQRNYIDISIAVSSPKGLVVPVIRDAHNMNIIQLEKAVAALADKARKNALTIEDMEGGTFTISNGGVFGSMLSTPIINMPQSAILGMHSIQERPVAINGKVEIRPIMYLALSYDHRLIDGREAVTFLKRIKDSIEDPSIMLMGF